MSLRQSLKSVWKKLGVNGQIKNFSSKELWVIETESGTPIARRLPPGFKTPRQIDYDGFKRVDGGAMEGHGYWWKIYDFCTAEIFNQDHSLRISTISKTAVTEIHFGTPVYKNELGGSPIRMITDVVRNKKRKITGYYISGIGIVPQRRAFELTCHHEIDNARPVFPKAKNPFIRTRKDSEIQNNISAKV